MERVVEHDDEQLHRAPRTVDDREHRLAVSIVVVAPKRLALASRDRPAGDDTDARRPPVLVPVADEDPVREAEAITDPVGLTGLGCRPRLHQAGHVGRRRGQDVHEAGLALLPCSVPPPDVPDHDPQRRFDERAVRRIGIEAHAPSLADREGAVDGQSTTTPTGER